MKFKSSWNGMKSQEVSNMVNNNFKFVTILSLISLSIGLFNMIIKHKER